MLILNVKLNSKAKWLHVQALIDPWWTNISTSCLWIVWMVWLKWLKCYCWMLISAVCALGHCSWWSQCEQCSADMQTNRTVSNLRFVVAKCGKVDLETVQFFGGEGRSKVVIFVKEIAWKLIKNILKCKRDWKTWRGYKNIWVVKFRLNSLKNAADKLL